MRIILCGAGEVGEQTAEQLVEDGHHLCIIDKDAQVIQALGDRLDVEARVDNAARAAALLEAGCAEADLLIAATSGDIQNLAICCLAKRLGCKRTVARVHDAAILRADGTDYSAAFDTDTLVCPELATAHAVARAVHNPAVVTFASYARGNITLGEYDVGQDSSAAGQSLAELRLPEHTRIVAVNRAGRSIIPTGGTTLSPGDLVVMVSDDDGHASSAKVFTKGKRTPGRIALMCGSKASLLIARQLLAFDAKLMVFCQGRAEANEYAVELKGATVLDADPTDEQVFINESLDDCDAMVCASSDEELNLLAAAWTRAMGVKRSIALTDGVKYGHILPKLGVDVAISQAHVAARQICLEAERGRFRVVARFFDDEVGVYEIPVTATTPAVNTPLRELRDGNPFVVAAIVHDEDVIVPTGEDMAAPGDTVIVVAAARDERAVGRLWLARK